MTSSGAPLWFLALPLFGVFALLAVSCVHLLRRENATDTPIHFDRPLSMLPMFIERDQASVVLDALVWSPTGAGVPVTLRLRVPHGTDARQAVETALFRWVATGDDVVLDASGLAAPRRTIALSHGDTLVRVDAERIVAGSTIR